MLLFCPLPRFFMAQQQSSKKTGTIIAALLLLAFVVFAAGTSVSASLFDDMFTDWFGWWDSTEMTDDAPVACGSAVAPECNGACPAGQVCLSYSSGATLPPFCSCFVGVPSDDDEAAMEDGVHVSE
jgi:hypothetical protein